ncbi:MULTISPECIES: response regulator transcription factor [Staphylococcus]|uniref:Response regulator ArlR n=1 Tax=Staphylococcus chromogenes TaxID=46126 RepID=A0AAE5T0Y0_STACR|nr:MULTISPECIES: response regulator transcription factor [Staphylococcus]KDP13383.1 two-component response regulator ArlR [Staphylococcus chromogenes MU 970]MBP0045882.1 response regulator transcription factor [Staphylococcus chromogenes]MBV5136941.1 response regulator transcription factor [Staphylococcus chromogenes]MBV5190408.1 response regulator transcription factor [Staphylococcus chromogenes]MBW3132702.1 response regulator transcription factor [Staphylococcus chromogenes]
MKKVLIIEDEQNLARFIELELKHEQYDVDITYDGLSGLNKALQQYYDIILLDLMLPEMDGLEVCQRIRTQKDTPIIMITAKGEIYDKVVGLDNGADDYIVKPFEIEELLARMRALVRRYGEESHSNTDIINIDGLIIDKHAFSVSFESQNIELTKTEFDLLLVLAENKNHVLQREQILDHVWGYESAVETNVVDVYIRYLRNKLKPIGKQKLIETVRGVGYVIRQ